MVWNPVYHESVAKQSISPALDSRPNSGASPVEEPLMMLSSNVAYSQSKMVHILFYHATTNFNSMEFDFVPTYKIMKNVQTILILW